MLTLVWHAGSKDAGNFYLRVDQKPAASSRLQLLGWNRAAGGLPGCRRAAAGWRVAVGWRAAGPTRLDLSDICRTDENLSEICRISVGRIKCLLDICRTHPKSVGYLSDGFLTDGLLELRRLPADCQAASRPPADCQLAASFPASWLSAFSQLTGQPASVRTVC